MQKLSATEMTQLQDLAHEILTSSEDLQLCKEAVRKAREAYDHGITSLRDSLIKADPGSAAPLSDDQVLVVARILLGT